MTELDGFESRLLRALIEIDADGAGRLGPPAAAVEHRRTQARRKRRFPSRALVVPVVAVLILAFGATAAASGLFAPAPPDVLRIFKKLPPGTGRASIPRRRSVSALSTTTLPTRPRPRTAVSVCTSRQTHQAAQQAHPASRGGHTLARWCSACYPAPTADCCSGGWEMRALSLSRSPFRTVRAP
jgi:hypothetical protein